MSTELHVFRLNAKKRCSLLGAAAKPGSARRLRDEMGPGQPALESQLLRLPLTLTRFIEWPHGALATHRRINDGPSIPVRQADLYPSRPVF